MGLSMDGPAAYLQALGPHTIQLWILLEPLTVLSAAVAYTAAAIYRRAEDEALDAFWPKLRDAARKLLGHEPKPEELQSPEIQNALAVDPSLKAAIERVWQSASVLRRALVVQPALKDARILWVDDDPAGSILEQNALNALGVRITTVETTQSALAYLRRETYDLILSDVDREGSASHGLDMLPAMRERAPGVPVIFYILNLTDRGVPAGAFGITNRPDELLHLCMDALERRRL